MDKIEYRDVAVLEINLRTRKVTLYEDNPMKGQTGGDYTPLPDAMDMKYAKVAPFGSVVDAALKLATNYANRND